MKTIGRTTAFRRDYKREKKGRYKAKLDALLEGAVQLLADDKPLPEKQQDHPLGGPWSGDRECHLAPDLLLIYRKPDPHTLLLVRLGSHSDLFG